MLDGLEGFNGAADLLGGNAGEARGADRGQHIFHVVRAFERDPYARA